MSDVNNDVSAPTDELANAIFAIRSPVPKYNNVHVTSAYLDGHYDARLAAMDLVKDQAARAAAPSDPMTDKLLTIIAYAYQIAGQHDAPDHILDVLANPDEATDEQIEAMLPYVVAPVSGPTDDEPDAADEWRRLALQFDGHRMAALSHLRMMLVDSAKHLPVVREFLAAPPLSGETVLAERIAALAAPVSGQGANRIEAQGDTYADAAKQVRALATSAAPSASHAEAVGRYVIEEAQRIKNAGRDTVMVSCSKVDALYFAAPSSGEVASTSVFTNEFNTLLIDCSGADEGHAFMVARAALVDHINEWCDSQIKQLNDHLQDAKDLIQRMMKKQATAAHTESQQ